MATIKPWNTYVTEAGREPVELPLDGGEVLRIPFPTGGQLRALASAQRAGDEEGGLTALLGADNAKRLLELSDNAPAGALNAVVQDVIAAFGLGESAASSPSSS